MMITILENISLKKYNSFNVEACARRIIEFDEADDLAEIFTHYIDDIEDKWLVLSGGNNSLFTKTVDHTILCPREKKIEIVREDELWVDVKVSAGVEWDDFVQWSVRRGLWGVENLSIIPGFVGAAPVQNIGAYGVELCDVVRSLDYFDAYDQMFYTLSRKGCEFAYRDSVFKRSLRGSAIITSVVFRLSVEAQPKLDYLDLRAQVEARCQLSGEELSPRLVREVVCAIREGKLPDTKKLGNAGSFFKNPVVELTKANKLAELFPEMPIYGVDGVTDVRKVSAKWLIEQSVERAFRIGDVGIYENNALVLVNYGSASGEEILEFARHLQSAISERFGVEIECEVNIY